MTFTFQRKKIPDVISVVHDRHTDERGFFEETFKNSTFKSEGISVPFLQDNHSFSQRGVLRGLHLQVAPEEQGKLVSVIIGRIFDVAVDVRPDSAHFGRWVSEELSGDNRRMLWIPPGFAHGFVALEDSHVVYKTTNEYSHEHERGIIWNDPEIGIEWPMSDPRVSDRDMSLGRLDDFRRVKR